MRLMLSSALLALGLLATASSASAAGFFHSVRDRTVVKECGACHMVYPPALLPARSWAQIIGHLDQHFGEDASLPDKTALAVLTYYTVNAGDGRRANGWFMRGVRTSDVPARITQMPFWRGIHGRFPISAFTRPQVKMRGNCIGCHG
jgi:hypothetical protein